MGLESLFSVVWSSLLAPVCVGIMIATYTYWLNKR